DRSSLEGKTVAGVLRATRRVGVPCAVFGGRIETDAARDLRAAGAAAVSSLTGDRNRAHDDLVELGERLARSLRESA
ncbi:MAG: glycerate kinase, partial [Actinomycetota bacterium]|nr:glycerate kinase [Actinomycetota bacterium]